MKASCIVPVYNAEKTIRRCVESIVYGQEQDLEVILVEDCSTDGSWDLCCQLSLEFSNVRCFRNLKNSGVSYTRNHGLQEAQGEYILFVDSDDWVSGRYASTFLNAAARYPNRLVISGFSFYDFHSGSESLYVLDAAHNESTVVPSDYFHLVDSTLIQSPCNKIFQKRIIKQAHLQFDVTQSMGEDFQFVLDYMHAAKVESCQVLNIPLYYYIRANDTSLMSKLGVSGFDQSADRLKQLASIGCVNHSVLTSHIERLKQNYVYHICRFKSYDRRAKLQNIEMVMQDGHARQHYMRQQRIMLAECLIHTKNRISALPRRLSGRIKRFQQQKRIDRIRIQLKNSHFSVISQNCIGGVFYHDMKMQFQSPTINLYFTAADFSKFVLDLHRYMQTDLKITWGEKYPVGHLDDITIYFQHYSSCTEAMESWNRRKARINWDKILVLSTDHEGFNSDTFEAWKKITYPKILFTAQKQFINEENVLYFPEYEDNGFAQDLISERKFYKNGILIREANRL